MKENSASVNTADREIVTSRVFDAPRELVWRAWTEAAHVARWWGPNGFTTTTQEMSVKAGGVWRFIMHGPNGTDYQNRIVFIEVVKPERLVYSHGDDDSEQFRVTVNFVEQHGKTQLTMRAVFPTVADYEKTKEFGAVEGGKQTLERLADYLPKMGGVMSRSALQPEAREVFITRLFDAPRELLFKAWSSPEHLVLWSAPNGCSLEIFDFDFRVGGKFRHCLHNPKYGDCLCGGVYKEIVVPERIVYSIYFCDSTGNLVEPVALGRDADWPRETTVTVLFAEQQGKTQVTLYQTVLESIAKRTGAYPSWIEMLDRLAEHIQLRIASKPT